VFHVTACNNDGIWNDTGASLAFEILPHFWQTRTFRVIAGLAVVGAVAWGVHADTRRRMRRKLEKLERQRAIERERTRIAKDMHDDLGASLTRITMLSDSARAEIEDRQQTTEDLGRINLTARELTRALDEIVWAVNPQHDTLDSLADYLCRFAQDFLRTAQVRCRLDVPVELPSWPVTAEVRHNLFLAFKEGLHNVVKHAAATEVRSCLTLEQAAFRVVIEDNGVGGVRVELPGEVPSQIDRGVRGNGLTNMRRRLEEIGGRFEVESAPGRGTRLTFWLPVPHPIT
jgi:signal transduction histidine kinase